MIEYLRSQIDGIMQTATETYGVNPVVFLVLYFLTVPIFYYSLYKTLKAVAQRRQSALLVWLAVFLGANLTPFLYVMLFGKNIPFWIYLIFAALIGQGVYALVRKIHAGKLGAGGPAESEAKKPG